MRHDSCGQSWARVLCSVALGCGSEPDMADAPALATVDDPRAMESGASASGIGALARARTSIRPAWVHAKAKGVRVVLHRAVWGNAAAGGGLSIDGTLRVDELPATRSTVVAKASCRIGEHTLVSIGELKDDDWKLYELTPDRVGQDIRVSQELFVDVPHEAPPPCQIEFRVVPFEAGPMQRIEPLFCARDGNIVAGPCPRHLRRPTFDDPLFVVDDWALADGFRVEYTVTVGERWSRRYEVGLRTACEHDNPSVHSVDEQWQWLDPGESYAVSTYVPGLHRCALTVERWRVDPETGAFSERIELGSACRTGDTIVAESCAAERPAPAPGPGPKLEILSVTGELRSDRAWSNLQVEFDLEAIREIEGDEDFVASAMCRRRKGATSFPVNAPSAEAIRHMRLGEKLHTRITGYAWARVSNCEITVSDGAYELARWCLDASGLVACPTK